jgi:hypothetical protein
LHYLIIPSFQRYLGLLQLTSYFFLAVATVFPALVFEDCQYSLVPSIAGILFAIALILLYVDYYRKERCHHNKNT